ncbi:MAG: glutathione S-transferase family protein [Pseudomonadaceae bacterium]|nr:glutathione S-transferase family protein [Pseudomonadaceae bacterium]
MVTVYDHPLSPYGQKVKIALLEKGVDFQAVMPDAIGSGRTVGEFADASPRGEVPALIDGDVAVFDSTIILEYIEDRWPEPSLLPADPAQRARLRMLEDVMDTHFEAITWGMSEIKNFHRATGELAETMLANAAEQTRGWFAWLEHELGDADWFSGENFGWGDLSVVPYVNGAVGFDLAPDESSRLGRWLERANQRDSVQTCAKAAAAVAFDSPAVSLEEVHQALEAGLFKREYRDHRLEWMIKSGGLSVVEQGLAKNNIRFIEPFAVETEEK